MKPSHSPAASKFRRRTCFAAIHAERDSGHAGMTLVVTDGVGWEEREGAVGEERGRGGEGKVGWRGGGGNANKTV